MASHADAVGLCLLRLEYGPRGEGLWNPVPPFVEPSEDAPEVKELVRKRFRTFFHRLAAH